MRGSDQNVYPPMSDFLQQQGITLLAGLSRRSHQRRARPRRRRQCHLARQSRSSRKSSIARSATARCPRPCAITFCGRARSIVITGTHGKTTTTSMTGWLLAHGGADPSVFIGGIAENFESSYRIGGGRDFVIEGDEYDSAFFDKTAKFLKYLPDIAVVNNIEFDHADIYPDLDAIRLAFRRFVNLVPRRGLLLLGADNADALALGEHAHCRVETFGLADGADWQAHDLRVSLHLHGVQRPPRAASRSAASTCRFSDAYNVRNALAAIAVGAAVGLDTDTMAAGLRQFKGVRRRMQLRGTRRPAWRSTTTSRTIPPRSTRRWPAFGRHFPDRRIWAIFEPRSATSCRRVFQSDFARALARRRSCHPARRVPVDAAGGPAALDRGADRPISRRRASMRGTSRRLTRLSGRLRAKRRRAISSIVMSNGGFDDIHQKLSDRPRGARTVTWSSDIDSPHRRWPATPRCWSNFRPGSTRRSAPRDRARRGPSGPLEPIRPRRRRRLRHGDRSTSIRFMLTRRGSRRAPALVGASRERASKPAPMSTCPSVTRGPRPGPRRRRGVRRMSPRRGRRSAHRARRIASTSSASFRALRYMASRSAPRASAPDDAADAGAGWLGGALPGDRRASTPPRRRADGTSSAARR